MKLEQQEQRAGKHQGDFSGIEKPSYFNGNLNNANMFASIN
jgi:hypothetical protein